MLLYLLASLPSVSLDPRQSRFGGALAQQLRALLSLVRSASVVWRLPPGVRRSSGQRHPAQHHFHHHSYLLHRLAYLLHQHLLPFGNH